MKKIKMAIVGAGVWGKTHAFLYREHPAAELVAVRDLNEQKARALAEEFGVKTSTRIIEKYSPRSPSARRKASPTRASAISSIAS